MLSTISKVVETIYGSTRELETQLMRPSAHTLFKKFLQVNINQPLSRYRTLFGPALETAAEAGIILHHYESSEEEQECDKTWSFTMSLVTWMFFSKNSFGFL